MWSLPSCCRALAPGSAAASDWTAGCWLVQSWGRPGWMASWSHQCSVCETRAKVAINLKRRDLTKVQKQLGGLGGS